MNPELYKPLISDIGLAESMAYAENHFYGNGRENAPARIKEQADYEAIEAAKIHIGKLTTLVAAHDVSNQQDFIEKQKSSSEIIRSTQVNLTDMNRFIDVKYPQKSIPDRRILASRIWNGIGKSFVQMSLPLQARDRSFTLRSRLLKFEQEPKQDGTGGLGLKLNSLLEFVNDYDTLRYRHGLAGSDFKYKLLGRGSGELIETNLREFIAHTIDFLENESGK